MSRQPPAGTKIDLSHPALKGLWLFTEFPLFRSLYGTGVKDASSTDGVTVQTPHGTGLGSAGVEQNLILSGLAGFDDAASSKTITMVFLPDTGLAQEGLPERVVHLGGNRDYPALMLGYESTADAFQFRSSSGGTSSERSTAQGANSSAPPDELYIVTGRLLADGSTELWQNGIRVATAATPAGWGGTLNSAGTTIYSLNSPASDRRASGTLFYWFINNADIGVAAIKYLHANLWQVFAPQRIHVPLGAASSFLEEAGDLTFTPDAGALALTGYAPTIPAADITRDPAAGALALTGYIPSLGFSYDIPVPAGSLDLTGYVPTAIPSSGNIIISVPLGPEW